MLRSVPSIGLRIGLGWRSRGRGGGSGDGSVEGGWRGRVGSTGWAPGANFSSGIPPGRPVAETMR